METNTKYMRDLGPIGRSGTFLWQMDSPSGAGINLWSGKLDANNGYGPEYAPKAAMLFEAAPELLEALLGMCSVWQTVCDSKGWEPDHMSQFVQAQAVINKAIGQ